MGHTKYPSLSSFYLLISLSSISLIGKEWGERELDTYCISNVSCCLECLRRKALKRIQHLLRSGIQQWKWITNQLLHLIFTGRMVSYHLQRISCSRAVPIRTHKSNGSLQRLFMIITRTGKVTQLGSYLPAMRSLIQWRLHLISLHLHLQEKNK